MIGGTLSHYLILERLGEGGMGVVYRAVDTRLDRKVAIKVLRPEALPSPERRQRFLREAKAASALNHPHIVTVYDIGQDSSSGIERHYIVMEHVDGLSLDRLLAEKQLTVEEAIGLAVQVADAISAAHEAGIVHRDIKPANIMVSRKFEAKLLDFGLAKLTEPLHIDDSAPTLSVGLRTEEGAVLGTAAYMSPEQAEGKPVDRRSDIFSFGSVLYEMLTGRRPFEGDSNVSMRMAILGQTPAAPRLLRPEVPSELERIVRRCLEKEREARYPGGDELLRDLQKLRVSLEQARVRRAALWRRPRVAIPAAVVLLAAVSFGAWLWVRGSRVRWARFVAIPEIARLNEADQYVAAYHLARRAREVLGNDRELERLWNTLTARVPIRTEPSGAEVYWKDYGHPEAQWEHAGRTPLENIDIPISYLRWRVEKDGFEPMELSDYPFFPQGALQLALRPAGSSPPGMVWVPGGDRQISGESVNLESFWIDKFEVTNRQFKEFLDAGGYRKREYWKEPFDKDGSEITWEEAMRHLVDRTGRPGPSTWELGAYPEGEGDYPVRGVSWYEAAAFAEFAGKSLPTVHHWLQASSQDNAPSSVLDLSNFDGQGPAEVGSHPGLGGFGTYDMAGNVKEWCWNRSGNNRYILGGAWNEPVYMYKDLTAQLPSDRAETYGFRCARHESPPASQLTAPIEIVWRDYAREKPVDERAFRLFQSFYAYDRTELNAVREPQESGSRHWSKERITFDAAYGNERVIAYLFLPANAAPPFQTVVYFPGADALVLPTQSAWSSQYLDFVIRSGRAVLFPIYKGTYERRLRTIPEMGSVAERDFTIQCYKDLARSIDYLETRDDIDSRSFAYLGFSWGAAYGIIFTALEPRFKTSILLSGGLYEVSLPAEVDPINFAPRVTVPTLMVNGRHDFGFPLEPSQKPMFRLLGTPERDKRHALIEGGHVPPRIEVIKEVLAWLDRYLGPVETKG